MNPTPRGSTRDGFGQGLVEAAQRDHRVVAVSADLSESTRLQPFMKAFPERFFEVGVAEQNMVGVAAGLALGGTLPFAASYAVFSPGRSWDQLRVSICYSNLNVKIIGSHTGLTVGPDGATHQALEDIAITRVLPNLTVVVPCDQEEARKATHALAMHHGPCYLRLSRDSSPHLTTTETPFKLGQAVKLAEGRDLTIIACGQLVHEALQAATLLGYEGISARVLNMHTIKPLDWRAIHTAAIETGAIVTAEEHQAAGGLGSAVAEVLVQTTPVPQEMVAMADSFGESGSPAELLAKYHLTKEQIVIQAKKVVARKRGKHV